MYWLTGLIGLALIAAPYVVGYANDTVALWTSLIIGGATAALSFIEGLTEDRDTWEYYIAGVLGLVAVIAPFLFGFSSTASAMWTSVVAGILIAYFAGTRIFSDQVRET